MDLLFFLIFLSRDTSYATTAQPRAQAQTQAQTQAQAQSALSALQIHKNSTAGAYDSLLRSPCPFPARFHHRSELPKKQNRQQSQHQKRKVNILLDSAAKQPRPAQLALCRLPLLLSSTPSYPSHLLASPFQTSNSGASRSSACAINIILSIPTILSTIQEPR